MTKRDIEQRVLEVAADFAITATLFRNAVGRKLGLNIADSECLSILGIKGISNPTELARFTGLTTGSTTAMLDRLERAGFIKRRRNPKDRRGILIEINGEKAATSAALVAGVQKAHMDLIASYSSDELAIIADFLTRFTDNVKEQTALIDSTSD